MEFVDNCYLIHHHQGWLLWDTGITDAVASMPEGLAPPDPRATHWRRPKTLAAQLEEIGIKPDDVRFVAISHTHPDHIGNVELFPNSMLLVQKAEYEWPTPFNAGRFKPEHPLTKLHGDHDIFAAGSVLKRHDQIPTTNGSRLPDQFFRAMRTSAEADGGERVVRLDAEPCRTSGDKQCATS